MDEGPSPSLSLRLSGILGGIDLPLYTVLGGRRMGELCMTCPLRMAPFFFEAWIRA